ncbi:MAG: hypothetical protein IPH42_10755 [Bacteroidetes bacterium]|nr:hypothetical protein [Bacteroidota bacterium]
MKLIPAKLLIGDFAIKFNSDGQLNGKTLHRRNLSDILYTGSNYRWWLSYCRKYIFSTAILRKQNHIGEDDIWIINLPIRFGNVLWQNIIGGVEDDLVVKSYKLKIMDIF